MAKASSGSEIRNSQSRTVVKMGARAFLEGIKPPAGWLTANQLIANVPMAQRSGARQQLYRAKNEGRIEAKMVGNELYFKP